MALTLLQKLPHPAALSDDMRGGAVFNLSAGARDRGLAFEGPRHQIVVEKDAEVGGGAAGVQAACLVSIGLGGDLVDGAAAQMKAGGEHDLHIAQDALDQRQMPLTWVMHE